MYEYAWVGTGIMRKCLEIVMILCVVSGNIYSSKKKTSYQVKEILHYVWWLMERGFLKYATETSRWAHCWRTFFFLNRWHGWRLRIQPWKDYTMPEE